jgi:type IV pilus assembly protein PilA
MIVIVIVGVLSSVALPNFLSQTGKAKGTEAKSQISSIMKNAAAEYQQGGMQFLVDTLGGATSATSDTAKICENLGGPANGPADKAALAGSTVKTLFDYSCTATDGVNEDSTKPDTFQVVATGNYNDTGIDNKTVTMVMNLETGTIELNRSATAKIFGGTV